MEVNSVKDTNFGTAKSSFRVTMGIKSWLDRIEERSKGEKLDTEKKHL